MIAPARTAAHELIDFIDASPSPWHAVASAEARLLANGFTRLEEGARWQLAAGGRYYAVRGGASLIAFVLGGQPLLETGFRIVGAHTDSPGLRLKPKAASASDGLARLGVEVYGGPILATFTPQPEPGRAHRVARGGGPGNPAAALRAASGKAAQKSIEQGGTPVSCPDFTRGRWATRKPTFAL